MDKHEVAVQAIADRVRTFHARGLPFRIYHGHTNSTRASSRSKETVVDTSGLTNVLKIDTSTKRALVEPNVGMGKLVSETLQHGLIPKVIPEFPEITVGGAFAGTAGESSSFKYGIFDSTVCRIEIVLADGTITEASETDKSDLLFGSAGACGTTGVITLLEVELMESAPYVELEYVAVSSAEEAVKHIEHGFTKKSLSDIDFLDGILFTPTRGVLMKGRLVPTHKPALHLRRFTRPYDQHFYRHVEKVLAKNAGSDKNPPTDTIPIVDYLFRYNRGCFWGAKYAFRYFCVPFNRITRFVLDPFMQAKVMFHALHESGLAQQALIQDVAFPLDQTAEFVEHIGQKIDCYPLWLCPLRPTSVAKAKTSGRSFGMGRKADISSWFCNVGVWCMAPFSQDKFVQLNRDIESKTHELNGLKTLYAHSYYTEEEFWDVYDKVPYDKLRWKYGAESLPNVYDKVKARTKKSNSETAGDSNTLSMLILAFVALFWNTWPFSGLYGVWRVIASREYLLKNRK